MQNNSFVYVFIYTLCKLFTLFTIMYKFTEVESNWEILLHLGRWDQLMSYQKFELFLWPTLIICWSLLNESDQNSMECWLNVSNSCGLQSNSDLLDGNFNPVPFEWDSTTALACQQSLSSAKLNFSNLCQHLVSRASCLKTPTKNVTKRRLEITRGGCNR